MIHIPYGSSSSNILRLTKVATIINPYYTFEFINQQSKDTIIFTTDNISPIPLIYDEFIITSSTISIGLTSGFINVDKGVYTYNIYETQYQYNLNLASASFLRSGECVIEGSNDFTYSVFTQSDSNTTSVFNIDDYL